MHDPGLTDADRDTYFLWETVAATTPPQESPEAARIRAALIAAMYHGFGVATVMEAMLAYQCIALRFLAMAATRALCASEADEKTRARLLARANALHRTQQAVLARLGRLQAQNARARIAAARDERPANETSPHAAEPKAVRPPNPRAAKPALPTTKPPPATPAAARPDPSSSPAVQPVPTQYGATPAPLPGAARPGPSPMPGTPPLAVPSSPSLTDALSLLRRFSGPTPGGPTPGGPTLGGASRAAILASTSLTHGLPPLGTAHEPAAGVATR